MSASLNGATPQIAADSNATEAVAPKPMRKQSGQPRDPARGDVGVLTVSGNS